MTVYHHAIAGLRLQYRVYSFRYCLSAGEIRVVVYATRARTYVHMYARTYVHMYARTRYAYAVGGRRARYRVRPPGTRSHTLLKGRGCGYARAKGAELKMNI